MKDEKRVWFVTEWNEPIPEKEDQERKTKISPEQLESLVQLDRIGRIDMDKLVALRDWVKGMGLDQ